MCGRYDCYVLDSIRMHCASPSWARPMFDTRRECHSQRGACHSHSGRTSERCGGDDGDWEWDPRPSGGRMGWGESGRRWVTSFVGMSNTLMVYRTHSKYIDTSMVYETRECYHAWIQLERKQCWLYTVCDDGHIKGRAWWKFNSYKWTCIAHMYMSVSRTYLG